MHHLAAGQGAGRGNVELMLVAAHRMVLWARKVVRDLEWRMRLCCPRCSKGATAIAGGKKPCAWRLGYFR